MRVSVDQERCVGAGQCARIAPGVFDQSEETGLVVLLRESPEPGEESAALDAVDLCPARAVEVRPA